ncbi:MAG: hypothetical protein HQK54_11685 [Oligoflexales bacterium]|nr:hypothetical protein [Oligoflexales bacterium]
MQQPVRDNLIKVIRQVTNHAIQQYCKIEPVSVQPLMRDSIDKDWMSIVLVSGEEIRMSYVIYFSNADVGMILEKRMPKEARLKMAYAHYMKEYCNIVGGKIKHVLGINGINVKISLPLCTRTCKDMFFFRGSEVLEDYWMVETAFGCFMNQMRVQVIDETNLIEVRLLEDKVEEDGEDNIEFF